VRPEQRRVADGVDDGHVSIRGGGVQLCATIVTSGLQWCAAVGGGARPARQGTGRAPFEQRRAQGPAPLWRWSATAGRARFGRTISSGPTALANRPTTGRTSWGRGAAGLGKEPTAPRRGAAPPSVAPFARSETGAVSVVPKPPRPPSTDLRPTQVLPP
jgi:hypothetical protein